MFILLTFAVSDGMSHALSPRPGKREEELVGVKNKKLLKNMAAASKSRTFAPSASFFFSCLFSNPSFHFFSDAAHVPTSDSDLHDVFGLCLPAAL